MKVGIYARVSTKDKDQDVGSQFEQMKEYCTKKGWETAEYSDEESGKLEAEPAREDLERMLKDLKEGKIDGVIITDQRRFARSVELGTRLVRLIRGYGKFIEVAQSGLHVDAQHYGMAEMVQMVVGFMMGEVDNIQHALDVKRGLDAMKKELQEKHGDGWRSYWKWGRRPKELDVAKVISLRKDGRSLRDIAKAMGCTTTPIQRILKANRPKPS